jgi:hypothetical protein
MDGFLKASFNLYSEAKRLSIFFISLLAVNPHDVSDFLTVHHLQGNVYGVTITLLVTFNGYRVCYFSKPFDVNRAPKRADQAWPSSACRMAGGPGLQ